MINNSKLIVVIPARGGSKGIKKKNLIEINGVSIVERAFRLARKNPFVDKIIISTDDSEIYALSKRLGVSTPKPRPYYLASDTAKTIDIIKNLVDEKSIYCDDCLLLMQPTTPFRTLEDLNNVINLIKKNWDKYDAVISINEIDGPHPFKAQIISDGKVEPLMKTETSVPRQSLPKVYIPNGAFYLIKVSVLMQENTFIPKMTLPYIMNNISSINLDSTLDLILLESIVERGLANNAISDSN